MASTHNLGIPGCVLFTEGQGGLPKLEINTAWSRAEVYLHGAHITQFQKKEEPPILFLSEQSRFVEGTPIRGGIPIIFPWFGSRQGQPSHGFARNQTWELRDVRKMPGGEVNLRLALPDSPAAAAFPKFSVNYSVTVGKTLAAELTVANLSRQDFVFEDCLHSYFAVGDIAAVSVTGLKDTIYLDQTENFARKTEQAEDIKISQETDRTYLHTTATVDIIDTNLRRRIRIDKTGSRSTVVWNPWIEKSKKLPDFGDDEYKQMICVESGDVADNRITLRPGQSTTLKIEISTEDLP